MFATRKIQAQLMVHLSFFIAFLILFSTQTKAARSFTQVPVETTPWRLSYVGESYDSGLDQTTFTYKMMVTGAPALSHWVLQMPDEAFEYLGASPVAILMDRPDPTTGLTGLKWDDGQPEGSTWYYRLVLKGAWTVGERLYTVKGATIFAEARTLGPVAKKSVVINRFDLGGVAFLDSNQNGYLSMDEPLLDKVTVHLFDGAGALISTATTDATGHYLFKDLLPGYYLVKIPAATPAMQGDFNEDLAAYFAGLYPQGLVIGIQNLDVLDVHFGYRMNMVAVKEAVNPESAAYLGGNGKSIGFWKHQHRVAITGKGKAQIDKVTLMGYLNAVEAMYLADPFRFAGDKYAAAEAVLSATGSDGLLLLKKQLLGTELNHVAFMGLPAAHRDLQGMILAHAEFLAVYEYDRATLLEMKDILDAINNTGE